MRQWKITVLGLLLALTFSVMFFVAAPVFAQDPDVESFAEAAGLSTDVDLSVMIVRLIRTAISFVGIVAVVFMLYGGFMWMTAGGNADRLKTAKKIILNSIIGIVLVLASFTIVQFILGALVDATTPDITSDSDGPEGDYPDDNSSSLFYLSSFNSECASTIQNFQPQFVFSRLVDSDTLDGGIVIEDADGVEVEGTFSISGYTVTFTPSLACSSPYETEFCFESGASYTVDIDSSVLESTSGASLSCTTSYPCTFSFTIGSQVDVNGPTVRMSAPANGESLYAGSIEQLQAMTTDDSGVSSVDFYVIDDDEAIYTSGVNFSTVGALTGGNAENAFYTDQDEEWDTEGYTTNEEYDIWATGSDCAGNTDTTDRVSIVLRAANCNNGVQDEDLGETGTCESGEDCDCGGDDTSSAYYCGACDGDSCTENSECSSGQCVEGSCTTTPKIESVSPGDGAVGNLVTISGEGFGDSEGSLTFLGTESGDEIATAAYTCNNIVQWSDEEIIVAVPTSTVDGPISVTASDSNSDRTDDDYGSSIADFDVNLIERPGICMLDPDEDDYGSLIDVYGNSFGDSQGSSTFYFTNYEASSYPSWDDADGEFIQVVVPNVNSGNYRTQVFTGDYVCVSADGTASTTTCTDDADCDTTTGETCATSWCSETLDYCDEDDDCGTDGGTCESVRVGSNEVLFEVLDTSSETSPIISSIDSGWKACSDDNTHCGDDDDCTDGATCDDADNWGPSGQYITIYGTGFGTRLGSINFEHPTLGYTALGDTDFPDACGDDFWHDTYITVKVPETYLTETLDAIEFTTHDLSVERADGVESDAEDFVVLDDTPGPAICDIDPSSGPADAEVTMYGENFGSTDGTVTFYSLQEADYTLWANDEISHVVIPDDAATGSVYVVEADSGYESNSITFTVGDCRDEDIDFCATGESCCDNGTCSTSCETVTEVEAHYAFMITTGITPNTPNVLVSCTESGVSPTPWEGWSEPEDICVTASVEAEFDMTMDQSTMNTSTVVVRACTSEFTEAEEIAEETICSFSGISCDDDSDCTSHDDEECLAPIESECKNWEAVSGSIATDETGFAWSPASGSFETSTLYRVTLQGEDQIQGETGGYMEEDYVWEFTTSASNAPCEVGEVNVRPSEYTETEQTEVDYSAQLIAANDLCVAVSCSGYTLNWESDFDGAIIDTAEPGVGICTNEVTAVEETSADDPALISTTVTNATNDPSDDGELTINFLDPEIEDYFPQCSTACVNALPWGEFNTAMDWNTINPSSITLYECANSLCETSGLTDLSPLVSSIDENASLNRFEIEFTDTDTLDADTWYRIVVDGDAVLSYTGVALSDSGSNYGSDENRYFEDDFSWVFKTKDDAVSCAIDSVSVDPEEATMTYIGQRAEFNATGQGAPDDCSVDGQTLQSGSYTWEPWSAQDDPNNIGATSGSSSSQDHVVAYMVRDGEIELTNVIPDYCSASCLNVGAPVTTAQGVCGNGTVETSEECDDGGTVDDDGCSASCLNEGNDQCPATCDASGASCTDDESCEETCDSAACTSATDEDEACTVDADCESGECSSQGLCEDYTDAGSRCSNNGACDSGSCVGTCSITGGSCTGSDSDCLYASGDSCELSGSGCCGDGVRDWSAAAGGEDCDDGNLDDGDGCSSSCENEGSRAVGAVCGDGTQDWAVNVGGEDCDDSNSTAGDGCSRNCVLEGSTSEEDVYAICGDGTVGSGEDCDPGSYAAAGDGCSEACLNEGTSACPTSASSNCCGNGSIETGEECDTEEGCSESCLWEGSSYIYDTPSFCGDGAVGTGEECDALSSASLSTGDYGVSQIATGAPTEVNETTGYAISEVSVTVDGDVNGFASIQLQCACTTDVSCDATGIGCGQSSCCFERPTIMDGQVAPADNTADVEAGGDGYCRNTAIWIEFSEAMSEASFDLTQDTNDDGTIDQDEFAANLYLDLVSADLDGDGDQDEIDEIVDCPTGYDGASVTSSSGASRFWNWLKQFVLGMFGREANASDTFACHVPVTYELSENDDGTQRVYIRYSSLLEENAVYRLVVVGDNVSTDSDKDGVLSENDVTLCVGSACEDEVFEQAFAIGEDICDLDRVLVEDTGDVNAEDYESASVQYFSSTGEIHTLTATPQTYRTGSGYEEISPLTDAYEWSWEWGSSVVDETEGDIVADVAETPEDTTRNYRSSGYTGRESILTTATITTDTLFDPTTAATSTTSARTVTGTLEVTALVCENPWPSLTSDTLDFPYLEDDLPSYFSFYYCRDAGDTGTDDDLPDLSDPIDVTSLSSSGIIQELIFKVDGSSDAIGVRVLANDGYLSPSAWVEEQEFTGSFTETELDGYPAVESGNTLYAASANVSSGTIYPNIYVISYNEEADDEAQQIFDQILENWRFNGNTDEVTDINLCLDSSSNGYVTDASGDYISCGWDGDCFESCEDGTCSSKVATILCDAQKEKLTRDMTRLVDILDMASTLDTYGEENGHCAVTKGQTCEEDEDCPGSEECVPGFPEVQSGTFVPALSNSIWSSWNASLANDLGEALPTDPINEFYDCSDEGYDEASCWNGEEGTFVCPENSHLYGYQSVGGEDYILYTQLESDGSDYTWDYALNTGLSDEATVYAEYPTAYAPSSALGGFSTTPVFCDGNTWGDSSLCGDGTQGSTEACEIGDTQSISCDDADAYACVDTSAIQSSSVSRTCTGFDDTTSCTGTYYDTCVETSSGVFYCVALENSSGTSFGSCSSLSDTATCTSSSFRIASRLVCGRTVSGDEGTMTVACLDDCSGYQTEAQAEAALAECVAYECGNGVVEADEECDDGSLNGTYGHCGDDCTAAGSFYCGDGYLAASEACDCGTTSTYSTVIADTASWASLNSCDVSNGQYSSSVDLSCASNCTQPGLACGDGRVNGSEECDGDYEDWAGALCSDGTTCTSDDDCESGSCGDGGAACGTGDICTDFDDAGESCTLDTQCDAYFATTSYGSDACTASGVCASASDAGDVCTSGNDCDSEVCGDFNYDLYRYRTCSASCDWGTGGGWSSSCVGGTQICGNGTVEGNEECDDGNSTNNDECLNTCVENVCGDDYVYVGSESCDDGDANGTLCTADYEGTCNYCNTTCQYKTASGGYCGDGVVDTQEVCDGGYDVTLTYYDETTVDTYGTCTTYHGTTTDTNDTSISYSCRWLGVCNGGDENGEFCTLDYSTYTSAGTVSEFTSGSDVNSCSGGNCVAPICADDCGSSCPTQYETEGLLVLSEAEGASASDSISLYSYLNSDGNSPDNGTLTIPACNVATSMTADIDDSGVEPPDVDIVFVTDLSSSMDDTLGSSRKIDLAVNSTIDAIEDLFDAYGNTSSSTMQVGLVSYTNAYSSGSWSCNNGSTTESDGAYTDVTLVEDSYESELISVIESYSTCVSTTPGSGSTPTYNGIEEAVDLLNTSSTADVKIVVLLSDGDFDWIDTADGTDGWDETEDASTNESCNTTLYTKSYNGNTYTAKAACAADMYEDFVEGTSILFYTAAITSSTTYYQPLTEHVSSNDCVWETSSSATDLDDCTGNYAFFAEDEEDIAVMYESIVDSILGTNVTFTATDDSGETTTTTGEVQAGSDVELPFPDGFVCQSTEQTVPLRNVFYGDGSMTFSDFSLTYCPYQ
ncbi:VWA domain-containing protein [Candidatus Uhrbacteria bacterium]|nr:VWA domain-containing protein [Candidatus Uhrbacteria bacterium]